MVMNNLLSYCGLDDARISASEKDLPVFFFTDSNLNVLRIGKFLLCNNWCVVVKVQHNYVVLHSLQGQFLLGLSIQKLS